MQETNDECRCGLYVNEIIDLKTKLDILETKYQQCMTTINDRDNEISAFQS